MRHHLLLLLAACGGPAEAPVQPGYADLTCTPADNAEPMPQSARAYAERCAEHGLGLPPTVACEDGVRVPTLVDGVEVSETPPGCDTSSMLKPDCSVGSTIQRVVGRDADGNALEDVTWVAFCRAAEETAASSVQMIGYHEGTGATCFFEANEGPDSLLGERLGRDEDGYLTGQMPGPGESDFDRAFLPAPGQCVACHQNNPFIRNPWLDQARMPEDPSEPVLPALGASSPYYVVGGASWDMRTLHIEGNACQTCHRIGMEIDRRFAANGFDVNSYMPPEAPGSMSADYQALLDCWTEGPENTPGCDWVIPPAGDCEGGLVDERYPYAAYTFNLAGVDDDAGKGDGGKGDDGGVPTCPDDFDPAASCTEGTFCGLGDDIWYCEDGAWQSK
jgi:hypothetical protein